MKTKERKKYYARVDKALEPYRHGDEYRIPTAEIDSVIDMIEESYYESDDFGEDAEQRCRDSGWKEPA